MDILYISPEFPPNYIHFVRHAHALGARVWAIGEAEFFSMPAEVRAWIRWYVRTDLGNWRQAAHAVDELLEAKHALGFEGAFDLVESHNENWLRLEAIINERFGIPGIRLAETDPIKKKSRMKRVFRNLGLPVARGGPVADLGEALQLADELGYPVILKPDEGVGAGGTYRVGSRPELENLFPDLAPGYVLEEFIDSPIITYDGLTDREGRILFENSLVYGEGLIEYTLGTDTFFYTSRSIPEGLSEIGASLVAAFNIRRKFFHFEFFARPGEYVPMEINSRPPGGAILDMMNYSVDGDLYRAWACMVMGQPVELPREKKYAVGYVGRKEKAYTLSHGEILSRFGVFLVEAAENPPVFQGIMGRIRYLFRSANEADIPLIAAAVRQTGEAS
jgi:biotin carboxylase